MKAQNSQAVSLKTAHSRALFLAQAAMVAALTILPYFTSVAVPGLFIGCLLSNILTGCALPDHRQYDNRTSHSGLWLRSDDRWHDSGTMSRDVLSDRWRRRSNFLRYSGYDTADSTSKISKQNICKPLKNSISLLRI